MNTIYEDRGAVSRFLLVQEALGPHADDIIRRYENIHHVSVREMLDCIRRANGLPIDPLRIRSVWGLVGIWMIGLSVLLVAGKIWAIACVLVGLSLRVRLGHDEQVFLAGRSHIAHMSMRLGYLIPCLQGKDGKAIDLVPEHVRSVALAVVCGSASHADLANVVEIARDLGFVSRDTPGFIEMAQWEVGQERRFGRR